MDKSKIDFNNIANLNCSNKTQYHQYLDESYTNDNILLFTDDDYEMEKKDIKKNNKKEFERILQQTRQNFISLSEKVEQIINSKCFSFKNLLVNNLNIKAIPHEEKKDNTIKKIIPNENIINYNKNENNIIHDNIFNVNNKVFLNNNVQDNLFNSNNKVCLSNTAYGNNNLLNNNNVNINNNSNNNNGVNMKIKNHFKIEPFNSNNSKNNIAMESCDDVESSKLMGKKRKQQKKNNNNNIEKIENEIKVVFNDILIIYNEISNINNSIIRKEEQNSISTENENIETTLIINDIQVVTIYLNKNIINKIYVFKNKKYLIKENEILTQLKSIRKNMKAILNKLKKK